MVTTINATNSIFSAGESIAFTAADTLNVLSDGFLASQNSYGAVFRGNNTPNFRFYSADIDGSIYSAKASGIALVDSYGHLDLTVGAGGVVFGYVTGVALYSGAYIINGGSILGGSISPGNARSSSAIASNLFSTVTIENHNLISCSEGAAIRFWELASGVHVINNSGTIDGYFAIYDQSTGNNSNEYVTNTGLIKGTLYMGNGNDEITTTGGEIRGPVYLQNGNDKYTGGSFGDGVSGGDGTDTLNGGGGNDWLSGDSGADTLIGGAGADLLTANHGNGMDDGFRDKFVYSATSQSFGAASTRDTIVDIVTKAEETVAGTSDLIDLSAIDANTLLAGNQAFTFLAAPGAAYTGVAGQIKWSRTDLAGTFNDFTMVYADTNGDGASDFAIKINGLETLQRWDFVL